MPSALAARLPGALAYRPIFALAGLSTAACFAILLSLTDLPSPPPKQPAPPGERRDERRRLLGLTGVNLLNGLGISMVGPFIAYWFDLRFGAGPA